MKINLVDAFSAVVIISNDNGDILMCPVNGRA